MRPPQLDNNVHDPAQYKLGQRTHRWFFTITNIYDISTPTLDEKVNANVFNDHV